MLYMKIASLYKFILWEVINPILLKTRKGRRIRIKENIKGLNLGCGFDNPENWIGLEGGASLWLIRKSPKFLLRRSYKDFNMSESMEFDEYVDKVKAVKYIHYDIRKGLPFRDNSVPHIFSSHFLEHLTRKEAISLIEECYRVIRPGGIIRIVVPSLDELVADISRAVEEYSKGDIRSIQDYVTRKRTGFVDNFSTHKWMYNYAELEMLLKDKGFKDITECSYGEGKIPDVEKLDVRPGLIVEAIK